MDSRPAVIDRAIRRREDQYSSRIIKAGALLSDTKTLLLHWDTGATIEKNLKRVRQENLLGKSSRSRVEDILAVFRHRYLDDEDVLKALVVLVQRRLPAASLDRILYFHAAQADRLLHDVVTEWFVSLRFRGITDIDVDGMQRHLESWIAEGRMAGEWSAATMRRVAQGLLSTLRDLGILRGAVRKQLAPAILPAPAFAYLMFHLKRHQCSGAKLVENPEWRLFFLSRDGVERCLFEAHQRGLLEYHAAGSVTRLSFPVATLEEYAHVLAERAH